MHWTRKWGDVVSTYIGGAAKAFIRKAHTRFSVLKWGVKPPPRN